MLIFIANRNNLNNNEIFPTKHHSALNFMQKIEELSRECVQKLEDIRRCKVVPDELEPVNIPPFLCSCLKFETRANRADYADRADLSRRPRGK